MSAVLLDSVSITRRRTSVIHVRCDRTLRARLAHRVGNAAVSWIRLYVTDLLQLGEVADERQVFAPVI